MLRTDDIRRKCMLYDERSNVCAVEIIEDVDESAEQYVGQLVCKTSRQRRKQLIKCGKRCPARGLSR